MSLVKWALHINLTNHELQYANGDPMGRQIPVIPLADLAEVVEGLTPPLGNSPDYVWGYGDALRAVRAQLEAHTNGVGDE